LGGAAARLTTAWSAAATATIVSFADSNDRLAGLAAKALAEHRSGQTRQLDAGRL
jgi:hypothetical protein